MRHAPRALLAGGLGFAVSCLAACGGGAGLLSGQQADSLSNGLDQMSSAVQSGDCAAAAGAGQSLKNQVANLPSTINQTLSTDLSNGVSTASRLALSDCRTASTATTTATTAPATTTTAPTTTTTTRSTSTTTTPTTPTSTTPATTPTTPGSTSTQPTGGGGLPGAGSGAGGGSGSGSGDGSGPGGSGGIGNGG